MAQSGDVKKRPALPQLPDREKSYVEFKQMSAAASIVVEKINQISPSRSPSPAASDDTNVGAWEFKHVRTNLGTLSVIQALRPRF